jgi:hypothetical protein
MAFENHLLMYFFMNKPDEAREWWFGKRYGVRKLKREARKTVSYDEVYGRLSKFIHANFEATMFFWKPKGKGMTIWTTDYVPRHFYQALVSLLLFGTATLLVIIPTIFADKLKDAPIPKDIIEFNAINKQILKEASENL